ncbi:MAG: translation initiation factor IF-2 N-terminal domain-containing protein [Phycisphaerae bacterium]
MHTLAKELGVSSKAIIEKCALEGIEIKNHMHQLSAGLEATIREWFTSECMKTSVEDAQVDLDRPERARRQEEEGRRRPGIDRRRGGCHGRRRAADSAGRAPAARWPARPRRSRLRLVWCRRAFDAGLPWPPSCSRRRALAGASGRSRRPRNRKNWPRCRGRRQRRRLRAAAGTRAGCRSTERTCRAQLQGPKLIRMDRPEYIAAAAGSAPRHWRLWHEPAAPPPTAGTGARLHGSQ